MNSFDWRNATPEQINLWRYASGLIVYTTITPLYYMGAIAGSEFLTYDVGKLYIALNLKANCSATVTVGPDYIVLYNQLNAFSYYAANNAAFWDATAANAKSYPNDLNLINVWFSRITNTGCDFMIFNGYRLNV